MSSLKDTVFVRGDGWFDLARTHLLWRDVFAGPASVGKEGRWIDRPSVSMAYLYLLTGAELSDALRNAGRAADANAVAATMTNVAHATGLDAIAQSARARLTPGDSSGVPLSRY